MYGSIDIWILLVIALVYIVMIASCIVVVLSENRNPIRSLSWVVALIFLPGIGLVFYLIFGRSLLGEHMISRHNRRRMINTFQPNPVSLDSQPLSAEEKSLVKLARNLCTSFYTVNNEIEIFTDGRSKFEAMFRDLEQARESIYIQYYIFLDDELGHRMADLLIRKAREGLEVKVIYDHVGSFSAKRSFFTNMNRNGVETHPFFKVTFPQLANRINWRNHRKVTVIDRRIGYIGGMNVADRYIDSYGIWRDTHFRVTGNIIDSMLEFQESRRTQDQHPRRRGSLCQQPLRHAADHFRTAGALRQYRALFSESHIIGNQAHIHTDALFPADRRAASCP